MLSATCWSKKDYVAIKSTTTWWGGAEWNSEEAWRGESIADIVEDIHPSNVRISGKIWYNATL
jgi:hypothetical protein